MATVNIGSGESSNSPEGGEPGASSAVKGSCFHSHDGDGLMKKISSGAIIFCHDDEGVARFGQVVRTFDPNEKDSRIEAALKEDEIEACWHQDGPDEIVKFSKVFLVDKVSMLGNFVQKTVPTQDGQWGYCSEISVYADVKIVGSNNVVRNVSANRLRPLMPLAQDQIVCTNSWVGTIADVTQKVFLRSPCGSLAESDIDFYYETSEGAERCFHQSVAFFYPGQTVVVKLDDTKNFRWLEKSVKMQNAIGRNDPDSTGTFTVLAVELEGVSVCWWGTCLDIQPEMQGNSVQQPPSYITRDDLKYLRKLDLCESHFQRIGQWQYLKLEKGDNTCRKSEWREEVGSKYYKTPERADEDSENVSSDNDMAQDRAMFPSFPSFPSFNSSSTSPEDYDWRTDSEDEEDDEEGCESTSTGNEVMVETLLVYRYATVVWQDGTVETNIPSPKLCHVERYDELELFPGDFVQSDSSDSRDYGVVQNVDHRGRTAKVKWFSPDVPKPTCNSQFEVSVYDLKKHPDLRYSPWAIVTRVAYSDEGDGSGRMFGQVMGKDSRGIVKVLWEDHQETMCWPQDISGVRSWRYNVCPYAAKKSPNLDQNLPSSSASMESLDSMPSQSSSCDFASIATAYQEKNVASDQEMLSDAEENVYAAPSEHGSTSYQQLDSAPCTHKYHPTEVQPNNPQGFLKAVQREHRLFRTALPPGVWVRTFENRLDLLSVMIKGPEKTPYEDGLFLFDVQLGQDYPNSPPSWHFISYCSDRLNPNLYENGKVCVSLLGTWVGQGNEKWGPNSTLLQVIISIQGLILVKEPYFNEPGCEKEKGSEQGTKKSRMYNEVALLKLLQSMIKLIGNSPEIFREQILEHFRVRGNPMYQRIKNWINEEFQQPAFSGISTQMDFELASSSTYDEATDPPDFPLIPVSRGCYITLVCLLGSFQKALQTVGIELRQ